MAFLHGVEIITVTSGNRSVQVVPSSIIVLTGIAPTGPAQTPTIVLSTKDAAQFGSRVPGFNIPEALDSILKQGAGVVVVINTFDEPTNTTAVTAEAVTVASNKFKTAFAPVGAARPTVTNTAGVTTYIEGTDYSLDAWGNGVVLNTTSIPDGSIKITYKKLDSASVNAAQINGTITSGVRTGMKLIDLIPTLFGFKPKIIIAPGYSQVPAVSTEMRTYAIKYRAIDLLDAPAGTKVATALTSRGTTGTIGWNISSSRDALLFPLWKKGSPDPRAANTDTINEWFSALMAGIIANNDNVNGFWFSPSNKPIAGVVGPEQVITCSLTDSTAENQQLNAAGIVTYFNSFGTSLNTWGNRSSMFPTDTQAVNFICVQRTKDILEDSIEIAMLPFVDQPINKGGIDSVRGTVNAFINTLIQRGALIDGSCTFDPSLNSDVELAAGHVVFTLEFMSPTPMERITFNSFVDISLLSQLLA
jgi:phage tail sheath protein FI